MKVFGNFIFFAFICSLSAYSQANLTLSGTLVDKTSHEPILAGTVTLLQAKDSSYVDGSISDANGVFSFQHLKPNNYIVKVTYIGYLTFFKNISLTKSQPVTRLGELALGTDEVLLKEAVVEGKRPEIAVKNDTVEYDAASYKAGEDAAVEDLLKKLPGVEVDKDGNVTAQGKSVSKMYVNGKEFFRDDPQVATKNIPADIVDKVQVYDRKTDLAQMTGFDSGDDETVINLTVKAGMMQGTIGNVQVGAGQDAQSDNDLRYSENAFVRHQRGNDSYTLITRVNNNNNMGGADIMGGPGGRGGNGGGGAGITKAQNYMLNVNKQFSPQLNVNGDVRYSEQDRNTLFNISQVTFAQALTQQETINQNNYNSGDNVSSNFRIDWNPNKQNSFIISPNFRLNQTNGDGLEYDKRINLDDQSVLLDSKSLTSSRGKNYSFGGTMDYSFKFPKAGRVFSIDLNGNYNNNYSQPKNVTYYPADELDSLYSSIALNQWAENKSLTNNVSATFSYVEPIGHNNFIQLLYRYSYSETESKNSTYNIMQDMQSFSPEYFAAAMDTALIITDQSRTVLRDATDQRIGLNFKAERKKFNLTFGFNVDPSKATNETYQPGTGVLPPQLLEPGFDGRLPVIKGDSLISSIPIDVVNYSPTVNFRYKLDQRSNIRVIYQGSTNQPSADQLRDYPYVDINHPNDQTQGNPNLKPSYSNNLRAEFNKYVPATQLMYGIRLNGDYVVNDIITITQVQESGKGNLTTYENINGNWDASLRAMINAPLSKKFSIGNSISTSYSNENSYINTDKNTMQSRTIGDNLNLKLQLNDSLYIGTTGMINYSNVTYTAVPDGNQNIYNYAWGANILWTFLPGWTFDSDINMTWRSGYAAGYNISQTLWNAGITKRVFKKQTGTGSVKLQIFDILQDRKNITATQSASNLQFTQTNVIPSYFMASFIYRFSVFPKSSLLREDDMTPRRGGGMRPDGPPPGGGGFGGRRPF